MTTPPRIPPGQVLTHGFPVLHAGSVPIDLSPERWSLEVHGKVAHPFRLSYAELLAIGGVEEKVDIHCVTSWSKLNTSWQGIPFSAVAERASPAASARFVVMECEQGFTTSLPVEVLMERNVLLAHHYDGRPLSPEHGGPVRMLVPRGPL